MPPAPAPEKQPAAGPHSVSLKVLRLSRPSLAISDTLPKVSVHDNIQQGSLAYPSQTRDAFPLTPLLTLPPSFGAAYVGEQFACTLCANIEATTAVEVKIEDIQIQAELQTPGSQGEAEALVLEEGLVQTTDSDEGERGPRPIQRIVRQDLKEEGTHVLAVTVTYKEVTSEQTKSRTFRKLYQFAAQQAVGVRTKASEIQTKKKDTGRVFVLEAQIENLTSETVVIDDVRVTLGNGLKSRSLNNNAHRPLLGPQDVEQMAFRLDQTADSELEEELGRIQLAQLTVDWRLPMGQDGTLKTGWLGCRKR